MKTRSLILLPFALLFICFSNIQAQEIIYTRKKIELSIKIEGTKRKSHKYFDNDTSSYTQEQLNFGKYNKNNFLAGNISFKKYFSQRIIISSEFRYKLWGFKEYFLIPNMASNGPISFGYSITLINIDLSLNVLKRIKLHERIEARPRIGITLFYPLTKGSDTTRYAGFDTYQYNNYYKGNKLKTGVNIGTELNYKLSNRFSLTFSCLYFSPLNNTYGWQHADRLAGTNYPWRKYQKKNDGLYLGAGLDFSLRKHYSE